MIDTKNVLAFYLSEDLKRYNNRKPNVKDLVLHNEAWYIFRYLRHLRYVEYYGNKMLKKQIGGVGAVQHYFSCIIG